jgi:hypothetical protein
MANPTGESVLDAVRLDFDRRLTLQFRGSVVTSDAGLLAYRELDDALGLSVMAGEMLADARTGKNGRHALVGLLRQPVFGRLAGYEDVWVHKTANVLNKLPKSQQSKAKRALQEIWMAETKKDALVAFDVFCMSSEHFGQLAWQFKRMSGSSGLKVQAAIAC